MVPESFGEFFVATATVAGALIGLLFVAISVRPAAAGREAHITSRLPAVAALSAFLDTLFLSLVALLPTAGFGAAAVTLGWIGLASMAALFVLLVVRGRDRRWPFLRGIVLVLGQGCVYVLQVVDGVALGSRPDEPAPIANLAILIIILFAIGVARAWEFTGADRQSLLGAAVATITGPTPAAQQTAGEGTDHASR